MTEKELQSKLEALEVRVAKLEAALAGGAKPADDEETITAFKETSAGYYVQTSKDRTLQLKDCDGAWYSGINLPSYINHLNRILSYLEKSNLPQSASADECKKTVDDIRLEYGANAGLPLLLPNSTVICGGAQQYIIADGVPSTKKIKF